MDIIEAIKSGRPFRRPHDSNWCIAIEDEISRYWGFEQQDLLADDWEIKPAPEEKIELSWKQIDEVLSLDFNGPIRDWKKEIKRKLGFKE